MGLRENIAEYRAAIEAGEPRENFIFATDGTPICRKTNNRKAFERIAPIIRAIKKLRPHNANCDLMMVTQDELTIILSDQLKDLFE